MITLQFSFRYYFQLLCLYDYRQLHGISLTDRILLISRCIYFWRQPPSHHSLSLFCSYLFSIYHDNHTRADWNENKTNMRREGSPRQKWGIGSDAAGQAVLRRPVLHELTVTTGHLNKVRNGTAWTIGMTERISLEE